MADSIIRVVNVDNNHPYKMKLIKKGYLYDFMESTIENPPRQTLTPIYIVNGAIYATKRDVLMKRDTFKGEKCLPYLMPFEKSVNIDNEIDMFFAEYLLKNNSI